MQEFILFQLLVLVASVVGTVTSFGTATIMVPVLALFYPLPLVLLSTGIIHWWGNVWKMVFFWTGFRWRLILWFGVPGLVASYLAAGLVTNIAEGVLNNILGVGLLGYVVFLSFHKNVQLPPSNTTALLGGILSGVCSGMFGVGGAIRTAFLNVFAIPKNVLICTAGAIGMLVDTARVFGYISQGVSISGMLLVAVIVGISVSFLGGWIGKKIHTKVSERGFRYLVLGALAIVAVLYVTGLV